MKPGTWPPAAIKALRKALGENTATFAARLAKSGRTIEDWEQGRRFPDALARRELSRIQESTR
jgi:DNA-binding transcriptional regulator YiaG